MLSSCPYTADIHQDESKAAVDHIYESPFKVEDRASLRYRAQLEVMIRELGGPDEPIRLIDISARGFRGECAAPFEKPCILSLALPVFGDVKARLVWRRDGMIGAQFLVPIDMQALISGVNNGG